MLVLFLRVCLCVVFSYLCAGQLFLFPFLFFFLCVVLPEIKMIGLIELGVGEV